MANKPRRFSAAGAVLDRELGQDADLAAQAFNLAADVAHDDPTVRISSCAQKTPAGVEQRLPARNDKHLAIYACRKTARAGWRNFNQADIAVVELNRGQRMPNCVITLARGARRGYFLHVECLWDRPGCTPRPVHFLGRKSVVW